jgi:hypothetical protein
MPNNNVILTNPTVAAASQFFHPYNIATTQEFNISNNFLGYQNPTEFAASQFFHPYNIATTQEFNISNNIISTNPTVAATSQFVTPYDIATETETTISNPTTGVLSTPTLSSNLSIQLQTDTPNPNPTLGQINPNQPFDNTTIQEATISNPTLNQLDTTQPYDIATIQEAKLSSDASFNPTRTAAGESLINKSTPFDISGSVTEAKVLQNSSYLTGLNNNTNITPNTATNQAIGAGINVGSSFVGVPQLAQIGNSFLDQANGVKPAAYVTLPFNRLKRFPGVKAADFRSRYSFPGNNYKEQKKADDENKKAANEDGQTENYFNTPNQTIAYLTKRRLDGTSALTHGSWKAGAYLAASISPAGAYSVFNLDGFDFTGYGWGDHDNPYAYRADFTQTSHVATKWSSNANAFLTTKNPLSLATPFRGDKISVIDFQKRPIRFAYDWKPKFFKENNWLTAQLNKLGVTQDFIKFYFTGPKLYNGNPAHKTDDDDIIVFRAAITNLDDSFTANWSPINMIGRADPNYHYTGFSRDFSISFDIYATDRDEVKPIYRKLNALAGYTAPNYDPYSYVMQSPWMRLTVGDLLVQQPAVLTSLSYTYAVDAPWEINIEDDPQMMQVPLKVGVSCQFNLVMDYLPQTNGRFFTLAKKYDKNGLPQKGSDNWLSDFEGNSPEVKRPIIGDNMTANNYSGQYVKQDPNIGGKP